MPVRYNPGMKTRLATRPTRPTPFKVAVVVAGLEYWPLAQAVNAELPPEQRMSERTISLLATGKKLPTLKQAEAFARILRRPVYALFPKLP
jgi:hypothetical protein